MMGEPFGREVSAAFELLQHVSIIVVHDQIYLQVAETRQLLRLLDKLLLSVAFDFL